MPIVNIHIEIDTNQEGQTDLLARIANAFKAEGTIIASAATVIAKETTPSEEVKADDTKKKKPAAKAPIADETKFEDLKKPQEPAITIEEVRSAFAEAKRSGKPSEALKGILKKHGANVVSELQPESYREVLSEIGKL